MESFSTIVRPEIVTMYNYFRGKNAPHQIHIHIYIFFPRAKLFAFTFENSERDERDGESDRNEREEERRGRKKREKKERKS